jgi:hypothetical protein
MVDCHQISEVDFDYLIAYDNKCFISQNYAIRRDFLRLWTQIPGGATYVAVDNRVGGGIVGYGCRRPAMQASNHLLGPLYADSSDIAEVLLSKLCSDVAGDNVIISIW